MIYTFDKLSQFEIPKVILCNPDSRVDINGNVTNAVGQLTALNVQNTDFNFNAQHTGNLEYVKQTSDNKMQNDWLNTLYNSIQVERYLYISDVGFVIITNVQETISGDEFTKKISWSSCDKELEQLEAPFVVAEGEIRTVPFHTMGTDTGILELVMAQCPQWDTGYIDPVVETLYRTFENVASDDLYSFLMNEVQDAYECVVEFDCIERSISFYARESYLQNHSTDINITHRNLIDEIGIDDDDDAYTAITVTGDNELEIRRVNPVGNNILYLIPEYKKLWMSSELANAVTRWQDTIAQNESRYEELNKLFYEAQMDFYKLIDDRNKEYQNWRVDVQWRDNVLRMADSTLKNSMLEAANEAIEIDELGSIDGKGYVPVHLAYNYESIKDESDWDSNKIYYVITSTVDGNPTYTYVSSFAQWQSTYSTYSVWSLIEPDWAELYVYNSTLDTYVNADRSQWIANQVELYRDVYGLTNYGYSRIGSYTYADDDPNDWFGGSIQDFLNGMNYPKDNPEYSYTTLKQNIAEINTKCSLSTEATDQSDNPIWTEALLTELINYIKTAEYNDEYVTVTDNMTAAEKFAQAKLLKQRAQEALTKISQGEKKITVQAYGFVFDKYFSHFTDQLESGCIIWVETQPSVIEQMHLTNFSIDYIARTIEFTFGSKYNKYDINSLFDDVLGSVSKNAQTIKAQSDIIDDAVKNLNQVNNWIDNAQTLTANNVLAAKDQSVIIDESGYWGRMLTGYEREGIPTYSSEQLKIINNGVYITDDNWKSVAAAIGKIQLSDGSTAYGVIGDVIIGKLLAGNTLKIIANTTDAITIYNGTETDANRVFYADNNGNLTLKGNIYTSGGEIAGWTIGQDSIYGSYTNGYTTYIKKPTGDDGNVFYVTKGTATPFRVTGNGKLYATDADITGKITATEFIATMDSANDSFMKVDNTGLRFYYDGDNSNPKITLAYSTENTSEVDLYLGAGGGVSNHTNRFLIAKTNQTATINLWRASGSTDNDGVKIRMSYNSTNERTLELIADNINLAGTSVSFNGNIKWS